MSPSRTRVRKAQTRLSMAGDEFRNLSPAEAKRAERAIITILERRDISGATALNEIRQIMAGLKTQKPRQLRNRQSKSAKTKVGERHA